MPSDPKTTMFLRMPKGAFVTITTGEHSDYIVQGVFRALDDIYADEVMEGYLQEHPEQREGRGYREGAFLAYAVRLGLLEPIDSFEWNIGGYGSPKDMMVERADAFDPEALP